MRDDIDEFRAYAAECERMAAQALHEEERENWLQLAALWKAKISQRKDKSR